MHVYLVNLDEGAKERLPIYTKENVEVKPAGVAIMTRSKIALELP